MDAGQRQHEDLVNRESFNGILKQRSSAGDSGHQDFAVACGSDQRERLCKRIDLASHLSVSPRADRSAGCRRATGIHVAPRHFVRAMSGSTGNLLFS